MMMIGGAEQAEADREHAGDATGAERHRQRLRHRAGLGRGSGAHVAARGQGHADVAGEARGEAAEDERQRAPQTRQPEAQRFFAIGFEDLGGRHEDDHRERDEDHRDRLELPLEVRPRALLDGECDLLHLRSALVFGEDALHQDEPDRDGKERRGGREPEYEPLTSSEMELLVAAFCGEDVDDAHVGGFLRVQDLRAATRTNAAWVGAESALFKDGNGNVRKL